MKLDSTPGPWNSFEYITAVEVEDADGNIIAVIDEYEENIVDVNNVVRYNARLIAAAPEMLEALIESCHMDIDERGCCPWPECNRLEGNNCNNPCYTFERIKLLEKATGKIWEELND